MHQLIVFIVKTDCQHVCALSLACIKAVVSCQTALHCCGQHAALFLLHDIVDL